MVVVLICHDWSYITDLVLATAQGSVSYSYPFGRRQSFSAFGPPDQSNDGFRYRLMGSSPVSSASHAFCPSSLRRALGRAEPTGRSLGCRVPPSRPQQSGDQSCLCRMAQLLPSGHGHRWRRIALADASSGSSERTAAARHDEIHTRLEEPGAGAGRHPLGARELPSGRRFQPFHTPGLSAEEVASAPTTSGRWPEALGAKQDQSRPGKTGWL